MRCPVLVGRETETALLRGIVAHAGRRSGTALLVGETGVGKSRLLADACRRAEDDGLLVLRGRAVAGPAPVPLRPLVEALQGGVRRGALHPDEVTVRGLSAVLAALLPALDRPADAAPADAVVRAEAVLALLATAAAPVVLALEDLHWADPCTLAVLEYLCGALEGSGVCVLATARDEQGPALDLAVELGRRGAAVVLELPRLSPGEVEQVATACLGAPPGPVLRRRLADRADGLPLLVEELVADGAQTVPRGVADDVQRALQQLEPGARRAVQVAAVLGRDVDWALLAALLDVGPGQVGSRLRSAVEAGLLECTGDGVRFRHALTRDAVLAALLPPERVAVAHAALQVLDARDPALPGTALTTAAELAGLAGLPDRAAALQDEAARRRRSDGPHDVHCAPPARLQGAVVVAPPQRRALADDPRLAALGVTPREADVLVLLTEGATNREVAQRLFLSPRTVEKHVERLLAKTGATNRATLAVRTLALGASAAGT